MKKTTISGGKLRGFKKIATEEGKFIRWGGGKRYLKKNARQGGREQ